MSVDCNKRHKLLIVDDVVENLQILSALLKDSYDISVVKSGEKALDLMKDKTVDLILLDVLMPGLNGFDVCKKLKEDPHLQNVPVIFLTALKDSEEEKMGFEVGGADFITKPFHPEVVKARVKTQIELATQKRKSDELLRVLLPHRVANSILNHGEFRPEKLDNVSIMFCDLVGFTEIVSKMSPDDLINELSEIFGAFDEICYKHKCTRIKTIGDAYMAVSGVEEMDKDHAQNLVNAGIDFIDFLKSRNSSSNQEWSCRIGIHSGNVIAGIVGKTRYIFDVMGDDVNIASRVESVAKSMTICITEETKMLLKSNNRISELGDFDLKGKGKRRIFYIDYL